LAGRKLLGINQKIQVSRDGKTWFNSSIQDLRPDTFSITTPYLKEHPLAVFRGERIEVRFFKDDSSYQFETRVTGEVRDNIRLIRLACPEQITRIQQRNHVRLPVVLDVQYAPVKRAGEDGEYPAFTRASSVDISGGGMKLAVRRPVGEKEKLTLKFYLPLKSKPEYLEMGARVIRCTRIDPQREMYHLGLRFDSITRCQQDIIVRFIFEKMAMQKRLQ